ncbi:MAG: sulfite exporter TauE/SafE family protein, partial [Gemmatimonadaceae bacterium]|nr:sulfite exporter TauE/SafE family protein [Gemmatimonadaceae bacterium]
LTMVLPPAQAAAVLVVPSLVTNLWLVVDGAHLREVSARLAPLLVGLCIGTALGIGVLTGSNTQPAALALGVLLALYGYAGVRDYRLRVPIHRERWLTPLVGLTTGGITGATGVFVVPAVPFIASLGLGRDALMQAMGLSFTVSTAALAIALVARGAFAPSDAVVSALALVPAVLGMALGRALRRRLSEAAFRRWFFISVIALGVQMVVRALG